MRLILSRFILLCAVAASASVAAWPAAALDPAAQEQAPAPAPPDMAPKAAERATRRLELDATQKFLEATSQDRQRLEREAAGLRSDRARLNATMIETTNRLRATENRITAIEERLTTLGQTEDAIRRSLEGRKTVIIEVLAALQRLGRSPPPAVLVRPEDMLQAVRTSMLLGAVLPELRQETEALASDLGEMVRLRTAANAERETLRGEVATLVEDRQRLSALVEARQQQIAGTEKTVAQEAEKAAGLAAKAQTLKDLIGRLETEIEASARAAEAARLAALSAEEQARLQRENEVKETRDKFAALAFKDPARLAPKLAFAEAKGLLPLPVNGSLLKRFNAPDAVGGSLKGMAYATRAGAVVTAPCDGWIAYAGPFRTYGQLLIINAGGGYYLLLAGMDRSNVSLGQFVLAGEPVAVMGEGSQATAASVGSETSQPVLYVEFRKDGTSIDPSPWWAASTNEKVRG
ncbi:membrane protein [Alsobacter metallidurans]|uniref:Membrane protein n=1 Tax=Alsobacter metallidurans TaxID=340221 RepID=A0A917IBJ7_9HYPH|nr:peptidoglycan DD-metalloendopeptidase family protein [Alsobacter metallidurans]GGH31588.1 membrane protein [Alsobacter metallidurans]